MNVVTAYLAPQEEPYVLHNREEIEQWVRQALDTSQPEDPHAATVYVVEDGDEQAPPGHEVVIGFDPTRRACALSYSGLDPERPEGDHGFWYSVDVRVPPLDVIVEYSVWGDPSPFPSNAGVPEGSAVDALAELLERAGARPQSVHWQTG
ncbi:hypothetical protein JOF53_006469 [Crossiella equi]|uniref:Uncharacterized protein n=1 Tax=Crossiella equi TaxID=130796 RepID=A0ABS5AMI4_9PSEU|nr:Imm1 family immunity protein [Crossiella equi]MBP2477597.1 hypothetical protein [Crossiella equi]